MSSKFRDRFGGVKKSDAEQSSVDAVQHEVSTNDTADETTMPEHGTEHQNTLIAKIAKLEEQKKVLENRVLQLVADSRNLMTRSEALIAQNRVYALTDFVKDMIDPFENLMIVLDNMTSDNQDLSTARQAVEMVINKFLSVMGKHGVKRIYPVNEKFDHNFHQAISAEQAEGVESSTILKVVRAGYTLNDRVISPALVVVSG